MAFKNFFNTNKDYKANKLLELTRNLFVTTLIGAVASFLSFIFNFLVANKLPENSFSIFSGVLGFIYLIQIPAITIQTYFTNAISSDERFLKLNNFSLIIRRFITVSLIIVLSSLIISPLLGSYMEIPTFYFLIASFSVFGFIYSPVVKGILLGLKKINEFNILVLIEALLKLLIFLVAINYSNDALWPILSFGIPAIIIGVSAQFLLHKEQRINDSRYVIAKKLNIDKKYLISTLLNFLFFSAIFSIDLMMVNPIIRSEYSALVLIGKIVYFASIMASPVLFSYMSENQNKETRKKYLFIGVGINFAVSMGIIIVFIFFGELIVKNLLGENYLGIVDLIVPLSLGVMFYSIGYTILNYFLSQKKTGHLYLIIITVILQILLFVFFNDNIYDATRNQVIVYITVFVLLSLYWLITENKKIN